jgi:hypothetical protein
VLVRQSYIAAAQDGLRLALACVALWWLMRWARWVVETDAVGEWWIPIVFISGAVVACAWVALTALPTELFNPECFALHSILQGLK